MENSQTMVVSNKYNEMLENIPLELLTNIIAVRTHNEFSLQMKKIEAMQTETNMALANLNEKTEILTEQIKTTHHVNKLAYSEDYVTATNLGKNYRIVISAYRMNKLLRFVGINMKHDNEPYREYYEGKSPICTRLKWVANGKEGYTYHYHQERTWGLIYKKLQSFGLYYKFISCTKTKEIDNFIDRLNYL